MGYAEYVYYAAEYGGAMPEEVMFHIQVTVPAENGAVGVCDGVSGSWPT